MATVMVEIRPKPLSVTEHRARRNEPAVVEPEDVELVEDMDQYVEHAMCSCSAGDDNPY